MRELKNKHVFVSCEVSNLGFKFARTLSCMPCIYWPHSADNGENPWNVCQKVLQTNITLLITLMII